MHTKFLSLCTAAWLLAPQASTALVVYTQPATALTTETNFGGGCCDGTGVWFNPLTGGAESRGFFFPDPLFADGQFFLLSDASSGAVQAQIYTQGFFSRGNGVIYSSPGNPNPARFDEGDTIGPGVGFNSPGAGFPDLGPDFGNWPTAGRGFLGLTLRDPTGTTSDDVFYGFADITVNTDYSITLNAFAYENVRGQAITASFAAPVPEPSQWLLFGAGLLGLAAAALTRRRRQGPLNC